MEFVLAKQRTVTDQCRCSVYEGVTAVQSVVSHPPHPSHEAQKPWEGLSPPGHRDLTVALGTTRDGTPQGLERQCHTVSLQNIIDMKYSWDTLNILSGFVLASLPGVQGRGWDSKL